MQSEAIGLWVAAIIDAHILQCALTWCFHLWRVDIFLSPSLRESWSTNWSFLSKVCRANETLDIRTSTNVKCLSRVSWSSPLFRPALRVRVRTKKWGIASVHLSSLKPLRFLKNTSISESEQYPDVIIKFRNACVLVSMPSSQLNVFPNQFFVVEHNELSATLLISSSRISYAMCMLKHRP